LSYPGFIASFIVKFLNASTIDGYNPYRISTDGIDWEKIDPDGPLVEHRVLGRSPGEFILTRLLELLERYYPETAVEWLTHEIFVYTQLPYKSRNSPSL